MARWRFKPQSKDTADQYTTSSVTPPEQDSEKGWAQNVAPIDPALVGEVADPEDVGHSLHRGLQARQVSMIAIGGALGTGLIIGTGQALANGGPGSLFISYSIVGFIVYIVMCALGEMATWIPGPGGFPPFASRFVDEAFGFATGYIYWFKYIIITPNQLTAAALVIQLWIPRDQINPGVWITIFLVIIIAINVLGIKFFGEFEFWLSSLKVIVILALIILLLVLTCGGGPNREAIGFRYWSNPGAFRAYKATGDLGRFVGMWSTFVNAVFAFLGTELVGITVGEAQNPRKNIPRAIKLTFWRILIFYILSVLLLGMNLAYNDPNLIFANNGGAQKLKNSAAASPFVVAIENAMIPGLGSLLNACILIFVFSACNSDLYIATRTLHGMALRGHAPRFLAKTDKRGLPYYSLGLSSLFCLLAYLNVSTGSATVFGYFVNLVSIFGLLAWISILTSHLFFIKARNAQGVDPKSMRYRSPFGWWGSLFALLFCILIAFTKNFTVFIYDPSYGSFDYKNFITGYIGIPLYLVMIFGWKFLKGTKRQRPEEADLWTGKEVIDRDEQMWLDKEAADRAAGRGHGKLYEKTIGLIF